MLVTRKAPDFIAPAVLEDNKIVEDFELSKNLGKNGAVLFFWPKDFTFVCPSEIIAMNKRVSQFKEKGFAVIGVSIDSDVVHFAIFPSKVDHILSLIHISEPTRLSLVSRMPSSA